MTRQGLDGHRKRWSPRGSGQSPRWWAGKGWLFPKWELFRVNWQEKGFKRGGEMVRKTVFEYEKCRLHRSLGSTGEHRVLESVLMENSPCCSQAWRQGWPLGAPPRAPFVMRLITSCCSVFWRQWKKSLKTYKTTWVCVLGLIPFE